jgi:hypothetical protein
MEIAPYDSVIFGRFERFFWSWRLNLLNLNQWGFREVKPSRRLDYGINVMSLY